MRQTIADLKTDIGTILTGIDLDLVPDFFGSCERAVKTFIQKADVPEASIRQPIMLYDGVTDYTPDERMFATALIDIRPQGVTRNPWEAVNKRPIEMFDRTKGYGRLPWGYMCTFEYRNGDPIMRITQDRTPQRVNIDSMTETTGWALGGNATTLVKDITVYYHAPAALRFNLAALGSQGLLTKTLTNALDLTTYEGVGVAFLAAYFPNAADIASVTLRLGSDSGNYWQVVVTRGFLGALYSDDYQLIAFDLANATVVGSPSAGAIDYVQLLTDYDAVGQVNVRYGDLWISLPTPNEMLFYSAAAFKPEDATAFITTVTDDTDEIIFRDAAYNIYVQEAAREVAKNEGATISSGVIGQIDLVLEGTPGDDMKAGLYQKFRGSNPSEEIRQVGSYYYDEGEDAYGHY